MFSGSRRRWMTPVNVRIRVLGDLARDPDRFGNRELSFTLEPCPQRCSLHERTRIQQVPVRSRVVQRRMFGFCRVAAIRISREKRSAPMEAASSGLGLDRDIPVVLEVARERRSPCPVPDLLEHGVAISESHLKPNA